MQSSVIMELAYGGCRKGSTFAMTKIRPDTSFLFWGVWIEGKKWHELMSSDMICLACGSLHYPMWKILVRHNSFVNVQNKTHMTLNVTTPKSQTFIIFLQFPTLFLAFGLWHKVKYIFTCSRKLASQALCLPIAFQGSTRTQCCLHYTCKYICLHVIYINNKTIKLYNTEMSFTYVKIDLSSNLF